MAPPVWYEYRTLPFDASTARNVPRLSPLNTSPPSVDRTPAQPGPSYLTSHFRCPVSGSIARSAPARGGSSTGWMLPPSVRSPTFASGVCRLMNFAHTSRTVTKKRPRDLSYEGDMKFVLPD